VAAVLLLVAYYLVCHVCTLGVEEERQGAEGPGDGYARLRGCRQDAVVRCGRNLARAMLFVFGFYRIRVDHRRAAAAQVPNSNLDSTSSSQCT
jgi:lysophosphatidylcholine acyltransferase/lyso-PAF acetyltransferase